jgi:two-component system chemotaxis sensor kinase CheA
MMALEDLGEIQSMTPSQEQIDTATSIRDISAVLLTNQSVEKVSRPLMQISEIDEVSIDGILFVVNGADVSNIQQKAPSEQPIESPKMERNSSLPTKASDPAPIEGARGKRAPDSIGRRITDLTFRMNVERMDNLMNLVGELITDRNHLQQLRGQIAAEANLNSDVEQLFETIIHLGRITDQLQEEVMSIRMLPIGSVLASFSSP